MTVRLREIGISEEASVFIVAEISANHLGRKEACIDLIDIAAAAGANAVKFQTYRADTITLASDLEDFAIPTESPWAAYKNLFNLYSEASTPWEWHSDLFEYAKARNLLAFSSAFDETAVDFLDSLGSPLHKLASPEINHIPLIVKMAQSGKPILISLGVASKYDLELALRTIKDNGNPDVVIMQCDTNYPAEVENANILQLPRLQQEYNSITGYSDHTTSSVSAVLAVGLGAKVFEKHLTQDSSEAAIDGFFSATENSFREYVRDLRAAEGALGITSFRSTNLDSRSRSKRSVYPKKDIKKNAVFTKDNLGVFRPGLSLAPEKFDWIIGKSAARDISIGERISELDVIE
jgi:pseudaminic acid synthase